MNAIHAGTIRGMYIEGENPAMSDPDLNHARGRVAKLEHLVVQDLFLTETAFHADVVLPASAFAEKAGTFTNTDRRVQIGAADHPARRAMRGRIGGSSSEIGRRMGLPWTYQSPADIFAEMAATMPSFTNITWERLEREGAVTYPVDAPDQPGQRDHLLSRASRPSPAAAGSCRRTSCRPTSCRMTSSRWCCRPGGVLEHWHTGSMTRRAEVLDAIEPEAVAFMSPGDLWRMKIEPGDFIRLETRRGAVEVKIRSDRDVPTGMVFMPFCYAEAAANLLTNPALDPFGKIPEFKFCAARVTARQKVAAE